MEKQVFPFKVGSLAAKTSFKLLANMVVPSNTVIGLLYVSYQLSIALSLVCGFHMVV